MRSLRSVDSRTALDAHPAFGSAIAFGALLEELVDRVAERLVQKLEERERRWTPRQDQCELLSVAEAAEVLRCKPQRVYDLRSAGRLPRTTEGGRAVVRRADVERLVDEE
jgi:excisionase family DNA binding protein